MTTRPGPVSIVTSDTTRDVPQAVVGDECSIVFVGWVRVGVLSLLVYRRPYGVTGRTLEFVAVFIN